MSFIVKKNISGKGYYYLNENKREGDKVKTKTIAYLGKTKKIAEKKMKEILKESEKKTESKNEEKEIKITYFVHGTTLDNEKKISSGWKDVGLSQLGIEQSKELKSKIKNEKFDVVFCSDLKRAVDSAKLTWGKNVEIIKDKRLRECNYGDYNGKESSIVEPLQEKSINVSFPNGENYEDVKKRMESFLDFLRKNYSGKNVAIVAHKAPQLTLEVLINNKNWKQAFSEDWRKVGKWQPGWKYLLKEKLNGTEGTPKLIQKEISIDEFANFCKRKGFVYPSSEIYGGLAGFWDFGSKGVLLKKNLEREWLNYFLGLDTNFFQIETSEIMPEKVFIASGHLKNFTDVAAKCKKGHIERADHLLEKNLNERFGGLGDKEIFNIISKNKINCSICKSPIDYVGPINMMFPIELGVGNTTKAFFRPETAQSPYVNFKLEYEINRNKLPLGLALVGRAYRNELSPRNMLIRQRAFNQAELQIFFNPSKVNSHSNFDEIQNYKLRVVISDQREKKEQMISCLDLSKRIPKFYVYYMAKVQQFYLDILQISPNLFRFYELNDKEKAFYNKYHFDMEINILDLGWVEMGGVHYRTDHDLKGHQEVSKQNLFVFDEESKEKFIPHVLELSFGIDRNFQALLGLSYFYDEKRKNVVLKIKPKISPIQIAVFPLIKNNSEINKLSKEVYKNLKENFNVSYDESGSIGRRYARNDEIGTPFCVTIDEESLRNNDVTMRNRDTTNQIRIKIKNLKNIVNDLIDGKIDFEKI